VNIPLCVLNLACENLKHLISAFDKLIEF